MASVRTVELLPEIFQTDTNKMVLGATLDQLVQEPNFKTIQGYVGRTIGPGVNPNDKYITEPTAERTDYQLEPGVVSLDPENVQKIKNAITYPGMIDALNLQGANTTKADRLFTSDYYTWDPFIDFDKMVNYSQYYWLPAGPDSVDVFAGEVPLTDNFVVTRENGVYTFSGVEGNNPTLTLVRQGNYTFQVAQNAKETVNFRVTNRERNAFLIDGIANPTLTLVRGNTYVFNLLLTGDYRFTIQSTPAFNVNNDFNSGVSRNGASAGLLTFTVPQDAPDTLYYSSKNEFLMAGTFNIINGQPGTGPGFWIQTDPGVNGRLPYAPNISSRDVLGVFNNGEDLGTVTFNVPLATAQSFYYNLTDIGSVDLVAATLQFDQINNVFVDEFLAEYGGIDGIRNLNGRTVIFLNDIPDAQDGGWLVTTQFDPLLPAGNVVSGIGSFDSTTFSQTTPIDDPMVRYSVWQIQYVLTTSGSYYMQLNSVESVNNLEKFTIKYGTEYASTNWYKNASGVFEQIPLLTAAKNVLYYQDGTDPEIFGQIRLIDQVDAGVLNVDEIIGKKNYTSPNGVVFTNGLKVQFIGQVSPSSYANNQYYVEGVGVAIKLLPVTNYVTPETYTESATVPFDSVPFDVGNFDASLNQPLVPDYLTINRASPDLNAWTRSNRWFHVDVINAAAQYNNILPVLDNAYRAKRPILEYRAGTRLYDFGTEAKQPVDIIDFSVTDAFSTIEGSTGYGTDGYNFTDGTRVIFAKDADPDVRDKIYVVQFITPDTVPPLIAEPIINLTPATDADIVYDNTVVCLSGQTLQGKSFWYDGVAWIEAQQKTGVNQAPLFNVYDSAGVSLSDPIKYPSSTFLGSKLFSYAVNASGVTDPVLGFALRYLSLANVGDIVFDNNLYTDTFTYVKNKVTTTDNISIGIVRQYSSRTVFEKELGWQPAITKGYTRQQFKFTYDGRPLQLDIAVLPNGAVPSVQVFVGSAFVSPGDYTVTTTSNSTTITLSNIYVPGDVIEVAVISDQASSVGFYQVPSNLENNPLNVNSPYFTLGTTRAHYDTMGQNLLALVGPINGANNSRDLGNIGRYGENIVQQSSPLTLAGYFMRSADYNIFAALSFNDREYTKFKTQLLDTVITNDYINMTVPEILNSAMAQIVEGRSNLNPFYWSDMVPTGSVFAQSSTTITPITTNVFATVQTYNFTSSNYLGLLVYLNDVLLQINYEYVVANGAPSLTITAPLAVGDVVRIEEYNPTYGNYVPNTPTKMGLYPAYRPRIYIDDTYVEARPVIQGHDGSITVAFGDVRDEILLEFETRIFNNLKIKSAIPLPVVEVVPGQFRTTDYSLTEINSVLSPSFLSWIGWNNLDYKSQTYFANNEFTWNYSAAGNKLTGDNTRSEQPLLGAWRGIYNYFYDTDSPQSTPWQLIGFSEKPTWWNDVYGPAPYTSDNLVLWDDMAAGLVADPIVPYIRPEYVRPNLQQVIPTGTEGQLLSPFESVVGLYDSTQWQKSWVFGDNGPVEASWRKSSSYPFAIMRMLALTRPAEFFSLFADRDLYKYNTEFGQYLYNDRYRLDANGVEVYGNGVSKASYINWIVDYNQLAGLNSTDLLTADLKNLDVRLCYRMASFTDKQYLNIYTEKSSPNSTNSSLLLPPESYKLLVYKNQPFDRVGYSAVTVQRSGTGYAVIGYSLQNPYFNILVSNPSGKKQRISAGGSTVLVPIEYTKNVAQVPYGYVFANATMVVDFLLSYGALLASQGLMFDGVENGYVLNWNQMAQEFLYWDNQGWGDGAIICLNPAAAILSVSRPQSIVDSVVVMTPESLVLDQNRQVIPARDLVITRLGNDFSVRTVTNQIISFLDVKFTSYETMVVLDNVSIFNDLIYNPATSARQGRIYVRATVSAEWNGQLDAQGFILNNLNTIQEWQPNRKYTKGEIVLYKRNYWSAQDIVQPSVEFNSSQWVKSDYTAIQGGLLANLPNKSDELANSYDTFNANFAVDQNLFAYGLIGFRPRQYMSALDLSDTSQVNVYQQFIKDKGTILSVDLFGNANLGKEVAEYYVRENWAILQATYGANANKTFIEFQLNQALLRADPSVYQVIEPAQPSLADQTVLYSKVWRTGRPLSSPDIFTTIYPEITDTALPTAGYVNIDDVDITVFNLASNLNLAAGVLAEVGIGTTIWAAKINQYDWGIYRCSPVPGRIESVTSNLNGTSSVVFSQTHNLSVGAVVILKYVDTQVDGVYRVLAVPSINTITIDLTFTNTIVVDQGLAYFLQTQRVSQASDVINLPYAKSLVPGARAWVDNNGSGHWEVLEKQAPFVEGAVLSATVPVANSGFGSAITQGQNNISALIGSPTNGAVYTWLRDQNNQYIETNILTLGTTGAAGYGNAVKIGTNTWSVAGASASNSSQGYAAVIYRPAQSNVFDQRQLLVAPDQNFSGGEFGYDVTISQDERWMYIGSPGHNTVYAYGRVDIDENQYVTYVGDGSTVSYNFSDSIAVTNGEQLTVVVNNVVQVYGVDYSTTTTNVVFTTAPVQSLTILIRRRTSYQLDKNTYYSISQDATSGGGSGAKFTVTNLRGVYTTTLVNGGTGYANGNTVTIYGANIGGVTPANNLVITVTAVDGGAITGFTTAGVGISNTSIFTITPYLATISDIFSFSVTVNGALQRPFQDYSFNTDSALYADEIVFNTVPAAGAIIVVTALSYFQYVEAITVSGLSSTARFGASVSTTTDGRQILIGAPNDDTTNYANSGAVYAFDRSVIRYIVSDPTTLTYALPAGWQEPVSVLLNNEFLVNSAQFMDGMFSVVGNNVVLSSSLMLAVGDILEIESNIFRQVQKFAAGSPTQSAGFGTVINVCPTNCSVYASSPLDSSVLPDAGSVDRRTNQARLYGVITSTIANASLTAGNTILVNNTPVTVPNAPDNTVDGLATAIIAAGIPNVTAVVSNGYLTISVINLAAADEFNRLSVLPGVSGTAFADLGFEPYTFAQNIVSPNPVDFAYFGQSLNIDSSALTLVVGAPGGTTAIPTTFDNGTTYFDAHSTNFFKYIVEGGAVYTYDYLPSANSSVSNPGKFVFGQEVYDTAMVPGDLWGAAVNYTGGRLLVGAPGSDLGDSSLNYGRVASFDNPTLRPAWFPIHVQQPVVDVYLINSVFMFDRLQSPATEFFDWFDPLQGKILGAARQNINYIGAVDPAQYNQGGIHNNGNFWGEANLGQIWWDTNSVRFIDPNQDNLAYAARRWGQVFPGSVVEVYQWVQSTVPPGAYTGPGVPRDTVSYTQLSGLDSNGIINTFYYFWAKDITTVQTTLGKTLSTTGIARYIEEPRSSGIPYVAFLNASTVAIYNGLPYISAQDTILHIDYEQQATINNIHQEFELIGQDVADSFLSSNLYRKLQDSFCGVDTAGAVVPDPNLSPAERIGVQFRPRQSMFVDRFMALQNYLQRANTIFLQYPMVENRSLALLNSREPEPTSASGEWDLRVANLEELSFQNLYAVPIGYTYLVVSDSSQDGLWTIYSVEQVNSVRYTELVRIQNYDTRNYWYHVTWYLPGYNQSQKPITQVPNYASLATLDVPVGSSVKVTANGQGKYEIYLLTNVGWQRVALEDGTIQISESIWNYSVGRYGFDREAFDTQYFDQEPVIETRRIIQAINEQLFIDDLAIERNRQLILMFQFILSETQAPEWLTKTSLIDVAHKIRGLIPFQVYRQDNQTFVLDYITEVKPYHVQIKEFHLVYNGEDDYAGSITDFDLPAYYDTALELPQYVSPVLLPYTHSTAIGTGTANTNSDTPADSNLWTQLPYTYWYNNYLLTVEDVNMIDGGVGYLGAAPIIEVTGTCVSPAVLVPNVNSAGQVASVTIVDPGVGYSETATITFIGGSGAGARAAAVMGNNLIRQIKTTIKYDRYQYQTTIVDWEPNVNYDNGTQVRYDDRVWSANSSDSTAVNSATFNPEQWTLVAASTLSGVDRTMGFYLPGPNEPGLSLPLLIDGVEYPGVQVSAPTYGQNTGFDVGNFDINPFDNIAYDENGLPTYDPGILDATYSSSYLDIYLGTRPTDINVDGGGYIDVFSSYAPEELIPGSEFDTMDFKVFTRPGADWTGAGHGFAESLVGFEYLTGGPTFSWANQVPYPVNIVVSNETTGIDLCRDVDYTVDWAAQTITVINNASNGDAINITVYSIGGGNQLQRENYTGADISGSVIIPVSYSEISQIAVFVNGDNFTNFTYAASGYNLTEVTFNVTFAATDFISLTAIGLTTVNSVTTDYGWSTAQTQIITSDGSLTYTLTNSLEYTNPDNLVVTVNGVRARTSAGAEYYADGSVGYLLPERLGFSQGLIADNQVHVYVNDIPQQLNVDFIVEPYVVGLPRSIDFSVPPAVGARILVCVDAGTDCYVNGDQLTFNSGSEPAPGDCVCVTTWNDTRQQNILTQVIVGPYNGANNLILERLVADPNRLWVTLNGNRLFYGEGYLINGYELVLPALLNSTDVVMITEFTDSIVPDAMAFRIFQDMRGVQAVYRMTPATTTTVSQAVEQYDDVIHVTNAAALSEPRPEANIWGIVMIEGERIMYRVRDVNTNTISSLLRGTAGTAVAQHPVGAEVYDMGRGNLLPAAYQNTIVFNTFLADGNQTLFVASNLELAYDDSTTVEEAVEVYVGGILTRTGYSITGDNPVTVQFVTAPPAGVEVTILVRQGLSSWYTPGVNTPSNGEPLQITETIPARFLRGL